MKSLTFVQAIAVSVTALYSAPALTEESKFPPITQLELESVLDTSYRNHRLYGCFLEQGDIPEELRSDIQVNPFYASIVVPELHFLWLRYFAALDYDDPNKRVLAKAKFRQALELLETKKQEGCVRLWKNAWLDGNPDAYLRLQEIFKENRRLCQILKHFPSSEIEMIQTIQKTRESLAFFYGKMDGSEELSLKIPHVSVEFARFAESKLISALEKNNSSDTESSIRHLLQGLYVHDRKTWTQQKIATKFNVSQPSVSFFLRGESCLKLVENVCQYYRDNPDFYFFEPRKKSGWGGSLSSFLPRWSSDARSLREIPHNRHLESEPLLNAKTITEKKVN